MTKELFIELFGYCGSLLVLVSFLMTSVVRLRVVNTVGSVIFMTYALIIKSYPTAIMNFCLVLINLRFLWKYSRMNKEYEIFETTGSDPYLSYLLDHYGEDIRACFPGISLEIPQEAPVYLVHCDGNVVGITAGRKDGEEMEITLDYTVPAYRDFSIGAFVYEKLKKDGIRKLFYRGPDQNHQKFLEKMGYRKTEDGYVKVF